MGTGESLSDPEKVRRLQTALHAKAKEAPGFRFTENDSMARRGTKAGRCSVLSLTLSHFRPWA